MLELTVRACHRQDVRCESPLGSGTTDPLGNARFQLRTPGNGFDGYFEVTTEGGISYLNVLTYKIAGDSAVLLSGPPASPPAADPPLPGTGMVELQVLDCMGANVQNGTVTASAGTVMPRDAAGNYVPGDTASGITFAVVRDVPEGLVTLRASKDGTVFADEVAPVRAGVTTSVRLLPLTAR